MSDFVPGPTPAALGSALQTPKDDVVAATVVALEQLDGLDVSEHPALFESIHADLRTVLNTSAHR